MKFLDFVLFRAVLALENCPSFFPPKRARFRRAASPHAFADLVHGAWVLASFSVGGGWGLARAY